MMLGARTAHGRGRPVPKASWVPTTAWQLVDIPGTRWTDYFKDNGSGIAPAVAGNIGGYGPVWDFSGAAYSRKHHEVWMAGGGHAGTTVNVLAKIAINVDSPTFSMVCAPSSDTTRAGVFDRPSYLAGNGYWPDGKPYSAHSYTNNLFIDQLDEFLSFGQEFVASSGDGSTIQGQAESFSRIPSFLRSGTTWRAPGTRADLPTLAETANFRSGARVVSADSSAVYYWGQGYGLYKYNLAANTHALIGGNTNKPSAACCNNGADISLHIDRQSDAGIIVKTCDLSTGVQTTLTVSGDTLPVDLRCYGVEYVPAIGKYVSVWFDRFAYSQATVDVTSFYVVTFTVSGSNAVAAMQTMTGTAPTRCGSVSGMAYDPELNCIVLPTDRAQLFKAFKVS